MSDLTPTRRQAIAQIAASRARDLRAHAADMRAEALEPLRAAWRMRAAELELVADALAPEPVLQPVLVEAGRQPVPV